MALAIVVIPIVSDLATPETGPVPTFALALAFYAAISAHWARRRLDPSISYGANEGGAWWQKLFGGKKTAAQFSPKLAPTPSTSGCGALNWRDSSALVRRAT